MAKTTLTTKEVMDAWPALAELKNQKIRGTVGFRLNKIIRKIEPLAEDYIEARTASVVALQTTKNADGEPVVGIGTPNHEKFLVEVKKLLDDTTELDMPKIPLTDFINAYGSWPQVGWYGTLEFVWTKNDLPVDFVPDFEKEEEEEE